MNSKRILVACEESQVVTTALRHKGFEAFSCDIIPTSGEHPLWHIEADVQSILNDEWLAIIAFPPCTDLAVSGAVWFKEKQADGRQQRAIDFFMLFANSNCKHTAIENPIGIMSTTYRKPDQIIQPYYFGDPFQKATCLWLKGLPLLTKTNIVDKGEFKVYRNGKRQQPWFANAKVSERSKIRSKTFQGIANAMADQWGNYLMEQYNV